MARLPTANDIIEYLKSRSPMGICTAMITMHFGCTSKQLTDKRGSYPGIYNIPELSHRGGNHFISDPRCTTPKRV